MLRIFILLFSANVCYGQCTSYNPMAQYDYLTAPITDYELYPDRIVITDCSIVKVFWWDASKMSYCYTDSNGKNVFEIIGYNSWIQSNGNPCELETVTGYGDLAPSTIHCFQAWTVNASRPSNFTTGKNILMIQTPSESYQLIQLGGFDIEIVNGKGKIIGRRKK